jgi:hypothetical protein
MGISRPTLTDLQFMAVTKQKISEMIKPEDWGLSFIHTLGSGTLGVCLIIVAVFITYKCYQRRKKLDSDSTEETSIYSIMVPRPLQSLSSLNSPSLIRWPGILVSDGPRKLRRNLQAPPSISTKLRTRSSSPTTRLTSKS